MAKNMLGLAKPLIPFLELVWSSIFFLKVVLNATGYGILNGLRFWKWSISVFPSNFQRSLKGIGPQKEAPNSSIPS